MASEEKKVKTYKCQDEHHKATHRQLTSLTRNLVTLSKRGIVS